MAFEPWDEEEIPWVLDELCERNHSRAIEICLFTINCSMKFEKEKHSSYLTKSALGILYDFDKLAAISFFKEHYKELPLDAIGGFIEEYSFVYYNKGEEIDKELVKLIKDYLKTLKKKEIAEIQNEYDEFMKAYKYM
jgi:hypothetical protein